MFNLQDTIAAAKAAKDAGKGIENAVIQEEGEKDLSIPIQAKYTYATAPSSASPKKTIRNTTRANPATRTTAGGQAADGIWKHKQEKWDTRGSNFAKEGGDDDGDKGDKGAEDEEVTAPARKKQKSAAGTKRKTPAKKGKKVVDNTPGSSSELSEYESTGEADENGAKPVKKAGMKRKRATKKASTPAPEAVAAPVYAAEDATPSDNESPAAPTSAPVTPPPQPHFTNMLQRTAYGNGGQCMDAILSRFSLREILSFRCISRDVKDHIDGSDALQKKLFLKGDVKEQSARLSAYEVTPSGPKRVLSIGGIPPTLQLNPLLFNAANKRFDVASLRKNRKGVYVLDFRFQLDLKGLVASNSALKKAMIVQPAPTYLNVHVFALRQRNSLIKTAAGKDVDTSMPYYEILNIKNKEGVSLGDILKEAKALVDKHYNSDARYGQEISVCVRFLPGQKVMLGKKDEVLKPLLKEDRDGLGNGKFLQK